MLTKTIRIFVKRELHELNSTNSFFLLIKVVNLETLQMFV